VGCSWCKRLFTAVKLYQQVGREIKWLRDEGKIPDDFADEAKNRYGFMSWIELLTAINEQVPDADRLEALKAMFYGANKINAPDAEKVLSYRLLLIAKRLTSGELLLLRTLYDSLKHRDNKVSTKSSTQVRPLEQLKVVLRDTTLLLM
jgi:hypothetical protein